MARAVRAALGRARRRHPRVPARHGGDPPRRGRARTAAAPWCCRCTATCRPPSRIARCAPPRTAPRRTGDLDRRDLADRAGRAHRGRWRLAARAAAGPVHRLTRLATVRISRAAADQRAGRAGREGPGVAIRLWPRRCIAACRRSTGRKSWKPNCHRWCWTAPPGAPLPADLPFQDRPPAGALAAARALLVELGALDGDGRDHRARASRMATLGAHPRLAAMMLAAETPAQAALAADLAALLEERDPLRAPDAPADIALRLHGDRRGATPTPTAARWRGSAAPPGNIAAACGCRRSRGRWRSGQAARRRLPRPDRPAPRRAGVVPPVRRRRRPAAAHRSAGQRRLLVGRGAGDEGLRPYPARRRAGPRRAAAGAGRAGDGAGGERLRPRLGRGAVAPPPSSGRAGAERPYRAGRSGRGGRGTGARRRRGGLRGAALELGRPAVPGAGWADAGDGAGSRVAGLSDAGAGRRRAGLAAPHLPAWRGWRIWRGWTWRHPAGCCPGSWLPGWTASCRATGVAGRSRPVDYTSRCRSRPPGRRHSTAWRRRRAWPEAACPCGWRCCRRPGGRSPSPATSRGFWRGAWADARRDMRGRYPKHDWPEHP